MGKVKSIPESKELTTPVEIPVTEKAPEVLATSNTVTTYKDYLKSLISRDPMWTQSSLYSLLLGHYQAGKYHNIATITFADIRELMAWASVQGKIAR